MSEATLKGIVPELGRILRLFRQRSGRNLGDVAARAEISISMLSQIERGVVSPSIDTLAMVCAALGVHLSELFRLLSPESPVQIHRRGERLRMERDGVRYEQLMISRRTAVGAELFLLEIGPGRSTAMSDGGHEGAEMGYCLAGTCLLSVGSEKRPIAAGDSVCFSARLPHRLANTGKGVFRAVWSISPPHVDYLKTQAKSARGSGRRPEERNGHGQNDHGKNL